MFRAIDVQLKQKQKSFSDGASEKYEVGHIRRYSFDRRVIDFDSEFSLYDIIFELEYEYDVNDIEIMPNGSNSGPTNKIT